MKNDPSSQSPQTDRALSLFREALDENAPDGGLESLRQATAAELPRINRRRLLRPGLMLPLAAAVVILSGAGIFFRPTASHSVAPVPCPHSEANPQPDWSGRSRPTLKEFLANPDRYQRVCYCKPVNSGSLRGQ